MDEKSYVEVKRRRRDWLRSGLKEGLIGREALRLVAQKNVEDLMKVPYSEELLRAFDRPYVDSEQTRFYRALEAVSLVRSYLATSEGEGKEVILREVTGLARGTRERRIRRLIDLSDEEIFEMVKKYGGWPNLKDRDESLYKHILKYRPYLLELLRGEPVRRKRSLSSLSDEEILEMINSSGGMPGLHRRDPSLYYYVRNKRPHLLEVLSKGKRTREKEAEEEMVRAEGRKAGEEMMGAEKREAEEKTEEEMVRAEGRMVEETEDDVVLELAVKAEDFEGYEEFARSLSQYPDEILRRAYDLAHPSEDSLRVDEEKGMGAPSIEESLSRVLGIDVSSLEDERDEVVEGEKKTHRTLEEVIREKVPSGLIDEISEKIGEESVFPFLAVALFGIKVKVSSKSFIKSKDIVRRNLGGFIDEYGITDYKNSKSVIGDAMPGLNEKVNSYEVKNDLRPILVKYLGGSG